MSMVTEPSIEVVSINISETKGNIKHPLDKVVVDSSGIVGDAHSGPWHRQVSILSQENIDRFVKATGRKTVPGEFAENITLRGIDLGTVSLLDRFKVGTVELEVTQIGKRCHGGECAIMREVGQCIMPREGIFCRVLNGGEIHTGDKVTYLPKKLRFKIITLSDRAHRGEYADKSGPKIRELLESFLEGKRWHPEFQSVVLPDDPDMLRTELIAARDQSVDVVFTTGGTGIGPRDFTPETVTDVCQKLIPGVMEHIRMKYGAANPNALLSRSVAGVAGNTLIYALPGSVKAVEEYMAEILVTLQHLLTTIYGLDTH